ncbi:acyl-CoA dehydrogenase [uncultured Amnibacterium sp.]|uniref:acyl-CoA dehydrogenase n=1 Tax=uncultured Amnibacterium sp. TaxID=1631851 RepID=UPI0035CAED09
MPDVVLIDAGDGALPDGAMPGGAMPGGAIEQARAAAGDVDAAIGLARTLAQSAPYPGEGRTSGLWSLLASVAAIDLTVARVVEPHLDALAILRQAALPAEPDAVYGVYAAERPGLVVSALQRDGGTVLDGVKPWCSLAGSLDRALVTAQTPAGRRLFAVDLHHDGASALPGQWHALGLAAVESGDLRLQDVPASPVGEAGWYLERPGFAWGGIGVAACWYGGAAAVAQRLLDSTRGREPDQFALAALGEADRLLHGARLALAAAAHRVDDGDAVGPAGALLAARVRGVVATAAERVLILAGHALGPAPLTLDGEHARRVADLTVYLRQHHAERDDARLGAAVREDAPAW